MLRKYPNVKITINIIIVMGPGYCVSEVNAKQKKAIC